MKTDDSFLATYYGIKWKTSSGYEVMYQLRQLQTDQYNER